MSPGILERMTVRALIVRPDGPATLEDITPNLQTLNGLVGGWLEAIGSLGDWHAYLNEEGAIHDLDPNLAATRLAARLGWDPAQALGGVLRGTAVFLGQGGEGEDAGAEEADVPEAVVREASALGLLDGFRV